MQASYEVLWGEITKFKYSITAQYTILKGEKVKHTKVPISPFEKKACLCNIFHAIDSATKSLNLLRDQSIEFKIILSELDPSSKVEKNAIVENLKEISKSCEAYSAKLNKYHAFNSDIIHA